MHKIRQELNQIRYYYSRREIFEKASGCVGRSSILQLVEKYNKAICFASDAQLYDVYVCIYTEGYTQEGTADKLGYSSNYVYKLNRKLIEFFYNYFKGEKAA